MKSAQDKSPIKLCNDKQQARILLFAKLTHKAPRLKGAIQMNGKVIDVACAVAYIQYI